MSSLDKSALKRLICVYFPGKNHLVCDERAKPCLELKSISEIKINNPPCLDTDFLETWIKLNKDLQDFNVFKFDTDTTITNLSHHMSALSFHLVTNGIVDDSRTQEWSSSVSHLFQLATGLYVDMIFDQEFRKNVVNALRKFQGGSLAYLLK